MRFNFNLLETALLTLARLMLLSLVRNRLAI